jgi:type II secretory pathway component GspD/PulD (secretin)
MRSVLALSAILLATAVVAQDDKGGVAPKKSTLETKRGAYVVKYAEAKDVAGVMAKHFKGVAEIHAAPEGVGHCLLISAPPAVFEEIVKTIDQLDRRPRTIAVDVYFVELQSKAGDDKQSVEKGFSGPAADVSARLNAMTNSGQAASVKRVQLGATEGNLSSLTVGEMKPYVSGVTSTQRGTINRMHQYQETFTQVRVTPSVTDDGAISLDLNIEDKGSRPSPSVSVGVDEKGAPIPSADFTKTSFKGKLVVPAGQAVLANASKSATKDGQAETLIIVVARIEEPKASKK